jgi:hypothetical protein
MNYARRALAFIGVVSIVACDGSSRAPIAPASSTTASVTAASATTTRAPPAGDGLTLPRVDFALEALQPGDAPRVSVRAGAVLVDDVDVGSVAPIVESQRLQRVDGLFNSLKSKRDAWKVGHPGASFPGIVVLRFDQDLAMLVVKSVFQTAAFAGYPNASFVVRLRNPSSEGRVNVDAMVPGPPNPSDVREEPEPVLHVDSTEADKFVLRWKKGSELLSVVDVPRDPKELAAKVTQQWKAIGTHRDPTDRRLDQAILHVDNKALFKDVMAVIDAMNATARVFASKGGARELVPAFNLSLAMN